VIIRTSRRRRKKRACSNYKSYGVRHMCETGRPGEACGRCCDERCEKTCEHANVETLQGSNQQPRLPPRSLATDRIGVHGPDPQPTRPHLDLRTGETPGWIARERGGVYYSDWLVHVNAPPGAPPGLQNQTPVAFDMRYNIWVYAPPRAPGAIQDPTHLGRAIGISIEMHWAYDRDYPGPAAVSGISAGTETRTDAAEGSMGGRDIPQGHTTHRTGPPAVGHRGEGSGGSRGGSNSRRRPAEDRESGPGKDAKRGKRTK